MISENQFLIPGPEDIESAFRLISGMVKKTPVLTCGIINEITGASLYFKCENFQKAGAFKYRGASHAILQLKQQQAARGVCTHSSGNHAQALALAAKTRKINSYIVMPDNAPKVKIDAVKSYGGQITFCQPTLEAREATLTKVQSETGAMFIHPYNNLDVIKGQATCFYETLSQIDQKADIVVCPVGGGGLLSGTLLAAKYFSSQTKVIAAEPIMANDAWLSIQQQKLIPSLDPITIADGLKTSLGSITWPIIQQNVHQILTTSEENISRAMFLVWERMKIIVEPSAAVSLAVIMEHPQVFKNKRVVVILSGGNVDLKNLPWK
jgi:threonine dehydratase